MIIKSISNHTSAFYSITMSILAVISVNSITSVQAQQEQYNFLIAYALQIKATNSYSTHAYDVGVLNPNTGAEVRVSVGYIGSPNLMEFSPDGQYVHFNNAIAKLGDIQNTLPFAVEMSWSHSGQNIAFTHHQDLNNYDTRTGNLFVTSKQQFNQLVVSHQPAANKLSDNTREEQLNQQELSQVSQLTENLPVWGRPYWSPDDHYIVFTTDDNLSEGSIQHENIYTIQSKGSNLKLAVNGSALPFGMPSWSRDGSMFTFITQNPQSERLIGIYNTNTQQATILNQFPNRSFVGWGSDNKSMIVLSYKDMKANYYYLNLETQQSTLLVSKDNVMGGQVSPDGQYLLYSLINRTINPNLSSVTVC